MSADRDYSAQILAVLEPFDGLVSAYLFGSFAASRAHRESDLDLGVLLDWERYPTARQRFEVRLGLIGPLRAATGREPDLVILNDAPPQLGRHILTAGRRLMTRNRERDHEQLRITLLRAADLEPFLRRARAVKLAALNR